MPSYQKGSVKECFFSFFQYLKSIRKDNTFEIKAHCEKINRFLSDYKYFIGNDSFYFISFPFNFIP